jgi:hypothetical protein
MSNEAKIYGTIFLADFLPQTAAYLVIQTSRQPKHENSR